jgi:hypothetical protein
MRTKILLTAAAALAAGVVASNAQVYSANVVGYANVTLVGNAGYTLVANPFDDGNGNQLTNIVSPSLPNKSQVITWNGTTYNTAIGKSAGAWGSSVPLPPGIGFFIKNGAAGSPVLTNTFVGNVIVNSGGSVTNPIPVGFSLVGSPIPYAGDATSDPNIALGIQLANKSQMIDWNTGTQLFDTAVGKSAGAWGSAFPITVGQGFFIKAATAGSNWVQNASF